MAWTQAARDAAAMARKMHAGVRVYQKGDKVAVQKKMKSGKVVTKLFGTPTKGLLKRVVDRSFASGAHQVGQHLSNNPMGYATSILKASRKR